MDSQEAIDKVPTKAEDNKDDQTEEIPTLHNTAFKKPTILIGKIGKLPRKVSPIKEHESVIKETPIANESIEEPIELITPKLNPAPEVTEKCIPLPYKEPNWSGVPEQTGKEYGFEILKSGSIIGNTKLNDKPFWVFGRLANCDICMAHPTISRYHAVLQYRTQEIDNQPKGFYLYDLSSTHGTFLNKSRLKSRVYARVQVGHMIKLGCSSRTYILTGPDEDTEEASELSITELKKQRVEDLLKRDLAEKEAALKEEEELAAKRKKDEEKGASWGMDEDADEESDLTENPFAQTNNEELYLDDPKKALRGFMEREGLDLDYDCSEQGMGQYLCKVVLPIDDERGKALVAEVIHKGKKKEAVIQCALEACRILDRHGLLRQATHESRKRKAKNWEENDFYDSDDDTYLDRTGTIEKKREIRMKAKVPQQPETYQSLMEKEQKLNEQIQEIGKQLEISRQASLKKSNKDEDSLDSYMKELKLPKLDKQKITQLKTDLNKLKIEHANIIKLINVARPADLPALVPQYASTSSGINKNKLPIFGKRIKFKLQKPTNEENPIESDSDEEIVEEDPIIIANSELIEEIVSEQPKYEVVGKKDQLAKCLLAEYEKLEKAFATIMPNIANEHKNDLCKIWNSLKKLGTYEDRMHIDVKTLTIKKQKIFIHMQSLTNNFDAKLEEKISKELKRVFQEIESMGNERCSINEEVNKIGQQLIDIAKEMLRKESENVALGAEELEKRRKKNQKRIQHRQERTEEERMRGYEEDAQRDDYNMWVPPQNQTGDGRTNLNDKLGY